MKIRFSHPTKTGGSSVQKIVKEKYEYVTHNHKPLCTYAQVVSQEIEFSFATIRNPYERVISMYNYFSIIHKDYSLNEFINNLVSPSLNRLWLLPQHYYVENATYKVDDIIRFESYEDDWKRIIQQTLGIKKEPIHVNQTKTKLITNLKGQQKEKVYEFYKKDFDLLGYDK